MRSDYFADRGMRALVIARPAPSWSRRMPAWFPASLVRGPVATRLIIALATLPVPPR